MAEYFGIKAKGLRRDGGVIELAEEKEETIEERKETGKTAKDETYEEFMKRHEKPEFVIHWEGKKE